jgi:uncharacterized integral membrane protein
MLRWSLGVVLILGIGSGILVGALNPESVALDLGLMRWSAPLGMIVVAAFAAGLVSAGVVAGLAGLIGGRRRRAPRPSAPAKQPEDA